MELVFTILFVLAVAAFFSWGAKKIGMPAVVGLLVGGICLNIPGVTEVFIEPNTETIFGLGDFALLCLMFIAGLESSWRELYRERKDSVFIAVFAAGVPFILGFLVFWQLGYSMISAFIIGICMSITAEATKARVLIELGKLKSRLGSAMMGAGIVDDIIGLGLFVLVSYILKTTFLKDDILMAGLILAFFTGVLIQRSLGRKHQVVKGMEATMMWVIVPFFFVSVGLHFDAGTIIVNPVLLLVIILVAMVGKMLGALFVKPLTSFSWKQLHLVGWAMNSRGAVEMAIAMIAHRSGMISVELYSALIIMALFTTIVFPLVITPIIKRNPKLMN